MERDYLLAPRFDRPLHTIAAEICAKHRISMGELMGACRLKPFVQARHEAWWRARRETCQSLPAIARFFNRDHSTVMHGIRKYGDEVGEIIPTNSRYTQAEEYQVEREPVLAVR